MSKLPSEDLIFEILSWLPVASLSRFRFVSKSWHNLITTSSCFAQSQLDRGSRTDNPRILFINEDRAFSTMELTEEKISSPLLLQAPLSLVKSTVLQLEENMDSRQVSMTPLCVGSYNGLICFNVYSDYAVSLSVVDGYYLWNPSTNEFKDIPFAPINIPSDGRVSIRWNGFGYDQGVADYKIISFMTFVKGDTGDNDIGVKLVVYTLGTNSWRNITCHGWDKFKLCRPTTSSGLEVNGSLHWIGRNSGHLAEYHLMSFDIADESCGELPIPRCFNDMYRPTLHVLRDCLCVLLLSRQDGRRVEVWMMEDYGVKESWVKLFSTAQTKLVHLGYQISHLLRIYKNGEILVKIMDMRSMIGSFLLYKPKSDEVVKFHECLSPYSSSARVNTQVYFGSLVHLKSGEILQSDMHGEESCTQSKTRQHQESYIQPNCEE